VSVLAVLPIMNGIFKLIYIGRSVVERKVFSWKPYLPELSIRLLKLVENMV